VEDKRSWPAPGKISSHHAIRLKRYASASQIKMNEYLRAQAEYSISLFQVAKVLAHRLRLNSTSEYDVNVKWLGLSKHENSWNPLKLIYSRAPHETEAYLTTLPLAIQQALRSSISSSG
jgi:hypothetical protein